VLESQEFKGKEAAMQLRRILTCTVRLVVLATLAGCASTKSGAPASNAAKGAKEMTVSADQMSAPARATLNRLTAGGKVESITREVERDRVVYDVEATIAGKHMEYLIADSDGSVLGTEAPIEFSQLPEPVRAAAEKHFGTTTGLTAMKGEEYGETQYEIEGMKDGKRSEITFDPTGKAEK